MNTTDLQKSPHGAGGFTLSLTKGKGNTRYSQAKKTAIIQAIRSIWTEGVYVTTDGRIKRQLLNGSAQVLTRDNKSGYRFI